MHWSEQTHCGHEFHLRCLLRHLDFRSIINTLKPSEVIALEPIYTVDLVEKMQQLLPNLDPWDIPTFKTFANSEPVDVFDDYLEQEASKGNKHAAQKYNLDCRKQCLFCFGRKHWPYGQTNRPENVNHVKAGLQRFVEDAKTNEKRRKMRQRGRGGSVWM
ncbi:uncharacterized protein TNCV_1803601 [Trichonephila clavipes]|uniref:Uncharacterized protein n=1 Tax=Trichonephila clavipes TaxID=2585209 RepID=A0A8X6VI14_TRICX|nr:uncharacterized protein TNCV_1803601 [Trichonephila clavipes]